MFHLLIRYSQYNRAILSDKSCHETFRKKVRNLFFGKIYDRDNLFSEKFVFRVESDELRRGVFDSEFFSKVHFQNVAWFASFREIFHGYYSPDTKFHSEKIVKSDFFHEKN